MTTPRDFVLSAVIFCLALRTGGAQTLRLERDVSVPQVLALNAAFSPDGRWMLVSGSTGKASLPGAASVQLTDVTRMLVLVELSSRKVRRHLIEQQPIEDVFGSDPVAFSPDGRRVLAVHERAIMAWDVENGNRLATWGTQLSEVAFSPDRRVALARKMDFSAREAQESYEVFDLGDGHSLGTFQGTGARSRMLPVDSLRLYLLLVSDSQVRIRDLRSGEERAVPEVQASDLNEVSSAISPDGRTLALGLKGGVVGLWELESLTKHQERAGLRGSVADLAFAPDGSALAFGLGNQYLCVWRLAGDAVTCAEAGHPMGIGHVEFASDSKTVATTGMMLGPTVKLWAVQ
jgi:WD40 repeat protein